MTLWPELSVSLSHCFIIIDERAGTGEAEMGNSQGDRPDPCWRVVYSK